MVARRRERPSRGVGVPVARTERPSLDPRGSAVLRPGRARRDDDRVGWTPYNAGVHPDEPGNGTSATSPAGQEASLPVRYLQYRGGEGMLAWAFHRISGVAIWAFVLLHVLDIWLVSANRGLYDDVLRLYASPAGRVGETLLGAALLYHALNGLRIIVMDFWPSTTIFHKQLWYASWVVFVAVGLPGAYIILRPIWAGAA